MKGTPKSPLPPNLLGYFWDGTTWNPLPDNGLNWVE
jgi:hypothetical protein